MRHAQARLPRRAVPRAEAAQHRFERRAACAVAAEKGLQRLAVREVQAALAGEQELAPDRGHRVVHVDAETGLGQRLGGHQPGRAGADDDDVAAAAPPQPAARNAARNPAPISGLPANGSVGLRRLRSRPPSASARWPAPADGCRCRSGARPPRRTPSAPPAPRVTLPEPTALSLIACGDQLAPRRRRASLQLRRAVALARG